VANALNDSDTVVGFADFAGSGGSIHAFRWTAAVGMEDLNDLIPQDSGWTLLEANGINLGNQIVGVGVIQGEEHAFLLTPNFHCERGKAMGSRYAGANAGGARHAPDCGPSQANIRGSSVRLGCKRDDR